jgi:uncharacterized protein with PIN domain
MALHLTDPETDRRARALANMGDCFAYALAKQGR